MPRERQQKILEVSIESDALFQPDGFINAVHELSSPSIIIHNIYDPAVVINALRRARNVNHVVDMGGHNVADLMSLHMVKVLYDGEAVKTDTDLELFTKAIRTLISASCYRSHL